MTEALKVARELVAAGISVIPVGTNKVPRGPWKEYLARIATDAELSAWFGSGGLVGVGRVCGAVSGNLETIDFDVDAEVDPSRFGYDSSSLLAAWREQVERYAPGLVDRLTLIRTPRPGWHVVYRCAEPVGGNAKLAFVPMLTGGWKAVIETRGEGGYCLHPGSPGGCHPSGGIYKHVAGPKLAEAPRITAAERATLLQAARLFNQRAEPDRAERAIAEAPRPAGDVKPGDDFNARATWAEILEPHGFTRTGGANGCEHWKRPGTSNPLSLTCNFDGSGYLYAFSPNCGFETGRGYSKFAAFALLNHAGDFGAAAEALARRGFGSRPEETTIAVSEAEAPPADAIKAPEFPVDLLGVPGVIARIMEWNLETARRPQPIWALSGAIAVVAAALGRKVRTACGVRPNLYILNVGRASAGKDHARQCAKTLLHKAGGDRLIGPEHVNSGSGLVSLLSRSPAVLLPLDEFGRMLRAMNGRKAEGWNAQILTFLLQLWSSSSSVWAPNAYGDAKQNVTINQPHVAGLFTTTPGTFFESLTRESMSDGFVSRLLVFPSSEIPPQRQPVVSDPPDELVADLARWCFEKPEGNNLNTLEPDAQIVHFAPEASAALAEFANACDRRVIAMSDDEGASLWGRAAEKAAKLALIEACSREPENPSIGMDSITWGIRLTEFLTWRLLHDSKEWLADNAHEAAVNRVVRIIQGAAESGGLTRSELSRRTQWLKAKERTEIVDDLLTSGRIVAVEVKTRTKTAIKLRPAGSFNAA